ncbi:MAG: hypothetical protein MUD12_12250 [Spirochaetes bacterium]|nr:hypothetical protein [Spirochaetota bacterium]
MKTLLSPTITMTFFLVIIVLIVPERSATGLDLFGGDLAGEYRVTGNNPNGSKYVGYAVVSKKSKEVDYDFVFVLTAGGRRLKGTGTLNDGIISVGYATERDYNLASQNRMPWSKAVSRRTVYQVKNFGKTLMGVWGKGKANEFLNRAK